MRLTVAADDRTGALETAAALADRNANAGAGVPVAVWPDVANGSADVTVIDLGSRHLDPAQAAARAGALSVTGSNAHKIDSTLRGNWAAELAARHRATGQRVLLVPAFPALGRVCLDGVVLVNGRPVAELGDARSRAMSSRPATHLTAVGIACQSVAGIEQVERWIDAGSGVAVADAMTTDEVDDVVGAWARSTDVLLAGTSAAIGAIYGRARADVDLVATGPALVIVGSVNDVARRQIEVARKAGLGDEAILTAPMPTGTVTAVEAKRVAVELAAAARRAMQHREVGVIVVIGGDTAAALLGDDPVVVRGSVTPGTAWLESPRFTQPVITRAGGFGDERALVDLLWGTLRS